MLLQICLHDVHFRHTVGYGRPRRKHDALISAVQFADILDLHLHIARTRTRRVRYSRYVVHFRVQEQVFVGVRFVHEQIIHAEVFKDENAVFLARIGEFFEHGFAPFFDALQILHRRA